MFSVFRLRAVFSGSYPYIYIEVRSCDNRKLGEKWERITALRLDPVNGQDLETNVNFKLPFFFHLFHAKPNFLSHLFYFFKKTSYISSQLQLHISPVISFCQEISWNPIPHRMKVSLYSWICMLLFFRNLFLIIRRTNLKFTQQS